MEINPWNPSTLSEQPDSTKRNARLVKLYIYTDAELTNDGIDDDNIVGNSRRAFEERALRVRWNQWKTWTSTPIRTKI